MDHKQLSRVEIKSQDRGEVSAVFSTFNVVDKDNDVTLPGAFTDGAEVLISSYGHTSWQGALPVGMGKIRTTDTEAILDGKFFMDNASGRETFNVVKSLGAKGQWSYGYDIDSAEEGVHDGKDVQFLKQLTVHEVSPVLVGAGVNTRTLSAKAAKDGGPVVYKAAIRPHKSAATNRPWDDAAVVAGIPDGTSVSALRALFAYVDSGADPEAKSSYKFPHHHGVDGPANVRALMKGIAVLNGARGGAGLPEDHRKAVYEHLAGHLRDADREPPELRPLDGGALPLYEKAFELLDGMSDYLDHARRQLERRAEKGNSLSRVNVEALDWVGEDLQRLVSEHKALVRRLHDTPREAVAEEFVRYLAVQRGANLS